MNQHPMRYVQMAQRVRDEVAARELDGFGSLHTELIAAEHRITDAEIETVRAYGQFRDVLTKAAEHGSKLAAHYLEVTTWDLT